MDSLYEKFVDLQAELKKEIKKKILRDEVKLSELIDYVNDYAKPTEHLKVCQSFDELMEKVDKLYDFLNCQIIVAIAKKFASFELQKKFQVHSKAAKQFRSSQPIKKLRESLKNIYDPHIHDLANAPKAHVDLNSAWDTVTIDGLYTLIKCFFPKGDQQSLLKNIKITSSSVHITYYMTESSSQIIADIKEKISFMPLIGIYGFSVNGHVILPDEHEHENFTFESGLLNAALRGNNEAVQFLLDLGVNVDCTNEQGSTALMLATECGHEPIVQTLISGGANVNIQDSYGWTALMLASYNGHFKIAQLLLNKQANVNHKANDGWTALMLASHYGHFQVAELLLNKEADVNVSNNKGFSALMVASQNGNFQVAELLLNKLANVDYKEIVGWTALMLASQNGHFQVAELLLNKEADVNISNNKGFTALMLASQNGHFQVTKLLLNKEANVNHTTSNGWTALMLASQNGHFKVAELLLNKEADVNISNIKGFTALMLASQNGHFQVIKLLLNKQANVNNTTSNRWRALMLASQNGHYEVAELLLNKKANVNYTTSNGWTALMLASQNGHFEIAKLLLNKQANVNHTANNGSTALMVASKNGHFELAELLLNKQANVNHTANNGATALILAFQNGHFQIVGLLLDANASPIITDSYGTEISSLLVAVYNNSPDTVDVLLKKVQFPTDHIMRAFVLACYGGHSTLINTLIHKITDLPQKHLLISCVKGDLAAVISTIVESELNPDTPLVCGLTPLMIATSCGHIELIDALIQAGADVNTCNDYGNNALDIAEGTFNKQQDVIQLLLLIGAVHNISTDTVIDELIFHSQNIPPHQLQHQSIEETDSSSTTQENKNRPFIASFLTPKYFMK